MKISVIIPTYNRPQLLQKCLDAIAGQKPAEPFQVVVVSDGHDVRTAGLLSQYDADRFKHVELSEHRGPAAARNAGVLAAKGRWVIFTDDDTVPHPDWLEKYAAAFRQTEDELIAFTGGIIVPRSENPTDFETNTAGLENCEFVTANCALSREAFERIGGFDEAFTMAWREDSDLHFKLLRHQIPIHSLHGAAVSHPVRKASWDVSIHAEKKNMFNALLFKRHPALYKEKIGINTKWNYYLMVFLAVTAVAESIAGKRKAAFISLVGWSFLTAAFTAKRLSGKRKTPEHVLQMAITSAAIPFYSFFWKLYGSIRFKKLLL